MARNTVPKWYGGDVKIINICSTLFTSFHHFKIFLQLIIHIFILHVRFLKNKTKQKKLAHTLSCNSFISRPVVSHAQTGCAYGCCLRQHYFSGWQFLITPSHQCDMYIMLLTVSWFFNISVIVASGFELLTLWTGIPEVCYHHFQELHSEIWIQPQTHSANVACHPENSLKTLQFVNIHYNIR